LQQEWVGEAACPHLAPSEPGKGVALVKKSSEFPMNYPGPRGTSYRQLAG